MPRIPEKDPHIHHSPEDCGRDRQPNADVDTKISIVKTRLEKELLQKDLKNTLEDLQEITEDAYVYVDDNGNPTKIKLIDITAQTRDIPWSALSKDVQDKILLGMGKQDKLIVGDNITIDNEHVISADVKVKSVNGQVGEVLITPQSIGTLTAEEITTFVTTEVDRQMAILSENLLAEVDERLDSMSEEIREEVQEKIDNTALLLKTELTLYINEKTAEIQQQVSQEIDSKLTTFAFDAGNVSDLI